MSKRELLMLLQVHQWKREKNKNEKNRDNFFEKSSPNKILGYCREDFREILKTLCQALKSYQDKEFIERC